MAALKRQLLGAVAASRRPGADPAASRSAVLEAARALEASGAGPLAPVSGRWSLVYSTNDDAGSPAFGPLAAVIDRDALQRASNALYRAFFAFAPALAGSAETGARGVANEQVVDLAAGRVANNVDVDLPWPLGGARVAVRGEVEARDEEGREVVVTFTGWELGPRPGAAGGAPRLALPLPRPRGVLRNTFCDDELRLSRGGRGGLFVTTRLRG